jgi:hypothetical protein
MAGEVGRGLFGSLRRRVAYEIALHGADNRAMRRTRYSLVERGVRSVLAGNSFFWFIGIYVAVALEVVLIASALSLYAPRLLPESTAPDIGGFLKDATSYLITAQVGLVAVVSIAVGLVTLIAQRDDRSSTNTDIQLYYDGSLAYEVVASSIALLLVLCVELFWPLDHVAHFFGFDRSDLATKFSLTAIHVIWLSINIIAFAQFIATSLHFVEPKSREKLRERYTANTVVPYDLWNRMLPWLYLTAPNTLLPAAADNSGPLLAFGHSLSDTGDAEITTDFKRQSTLRDVRSRLLGEALRRWWQRVEENRPDPSQQQRGTRLGREVTLALTPSFGREFERTTTWCRRSGGLPLDRWERWLIRRSFKFRKASRTDRDLPTPANFLEELADKVISQIDRLATTGFKVALDEMIRYHRFLLEVYASRSEDGKPLSLAEVGGMWEQPHQEWARQYRRVFERAAERISEETLFSETMAHVPIRLLPDNAIEHSTAVVGSLLDLGLLQIVFLEAWVTRHTSVDVAPAAAAHPRLALAGSDRRAYEQVVMNTIGAWESTVRLADSLYGWREAGEESTPLWSALGTSWPFLERHLRNTAYFLASAVWNEDPIGADRYRDALLRWVETVRVDLEPDYLLRHQVLLTPELFVIEWGAVGERLAPFLRNMVGHSLAPRPALRS